MEHGRRGLREEVAVDAVAAHVRRDFCSCAVGVVGVGALVGRRVHLKGKTPRRRDAAVNEALVGVRDSRRRHGAGALEPQLARR